MRRIQRGTPSDGLYQSVGAVGGRGGAGLLAFNALIDRMREASRGLTLRQVIGPVLAETGLVDHYRTEKEGQDRIENLEELVNAAEAFVTQEGFGKDAVALPLDEIRPGAVVGAPPGAVTPADLAPDAETGEIISPLAAFLTHAALEAGEHQAQAGDDAVQLMTVHAAKGLEFDAVFITGLEEGLFPHENAMSDGDGLEEERRLMYVAITRARKRLYLSFSQTRVLHGQTRYYVRSRFVDELPEGALKWLTSRNPGFGSGYAREYQTAWSRGTGLGSVVGAGRVEGRPAWSAAPAPVRPFFNLFSWDIAYHLTFLVCTLCDQTSKFIFRFDGECIHRCHDLSFLFRINMFGNSITMMKINSSLFAKIHKTLRLKMISP